MSDTPHPLAGRRGDGHRHAALCGPDFHTEDASFRDPELVLCLDEQQLHQLEMGEDVRLTVDGEPVRVIAEHLGRADVRALRAGTPLDIPVEFEFELFWAGLCRA